MPNKPIEFFAFRVALWRFIIDLLQLVHKSQFQGRQFGSDLDLILIFGTTLSLFFEQGKPVRASKIAAFLDFPRETLRRRIAELARLGLVARGDHGGYVPTPKPVLRHRELGVALLQRLIKEIEKS